MSRWTSCAAVVIGLWLASAGTARADGHWEREGGARYPQGKELSKEYPRVSRTRRVIQGNVITQEFEEHTMGPLRIDAPLKTGVDRWTLQTTWSEPPRKLAFGEPFEIRCEIRLLRGVSGHGNSLSVYTRTRPGEWPATGKDPRHPVFRYTPTQAKPVGSGVLRLPAPPRGEWFEVVVEPFGMLGPSLLPVVYRYTWVDDDLDYTVDLVDANPALYGDRMPDEVGAEEIALSPHVRRGTVTDGVSRLFVRVHKARDEPVQISVKEGGGTLRVLPARRFQARDGSWYGLLLYTPRETFGGGAREDRPRAVFDPAAEPGERLEEVLEVERLVLGTQAMKKDEAGEWVPQGEPREVEATLARPPVVLVHGLFSDPVRCWVKTRTSGQSFAAMLERAGLMPFLVNYQHSNGGGGQTRQSTFAANARVVWESPDPYAEADYEAGWFRDDTAGSWLGVPQVSEFSDFQRVHAVRIGGIRAALTHYRERLDLAATQADVVGHSMGGLLARVWAAGPDYRRPENYGAGDIHRLITISTPHHGSEMPDLRRLIDEAKLGEESYAAWMRRTLTSLISWAYLGPKESGALRDLSTPRPGAARGAPALRSIGATPVPSFAIATKLGNALLGQPNADLDAYYLHVYGALALMYFHNRPLLDAFVEDRAAAWRDAGPLQRRTDRKGEGVGPEHGGPVDWSGPEGTALFRRLVSEAVDESVYYWELRRGPEQYRQLKREIEATSLAPASWIDGGLSDAAGGEQRSLFDRAVLRLGSALVGGDLERLEDARAVHDVPLAVIGLLRDLVFFNDENDGTVRVESQLGGLDEEATRTFEGISHSLAPWSYPVIRQTIDLLKWEDGRFSREGFPAAGELMPCYLPAVTWSGRRVHGREAVRWAGYVQSHAALYGEVADLEDVVLVGRPVNRDSTGLLATGAAAKGMPVKGKTSNWGPQRGLICLNQRYSKLWRVYATDPERRDAQIAKYSEQTQRNLTDKYPPEGGDPRLVGRTFGVKRALDLPVRGAPVYAVFVDPEEADAERAVYLRSKASGAFLEWRNVRERIGETEWDNFDPEEPLMEIPAPPEVVIARLEPLYVLADGLSDQEPKPYLTADYDLLAIGFHRADGFHGPPPDVENAPFHPIRGAISPAQWDLVRLLNEAVITRAGHPSGDVTHHGPENQYDDSPYVDYPLLVFDPGVPRDGKAEVFLIRQGPVGYRDIHLKRYFADAARRDYNLYANGKSKVGWLWTAHREYSRAGGWDPRDAPDLGPYVAEQPRPTPGRDPEQGLVASARRDDASVGEAVAAIRSGLHDARRLVKVLSDLAEAGTLPGALEVLAKEGYLGDLIQTLVGADEFRALVGLMDPGDLARTMEQWVGAGHHKTAFKTLAEAGYLGKMFKDLAGTPLIEPVIASLVGEGSLAMVFEALDKAGLVEVAEEMAAALKTLAQEGDVGAMVDLGLRLAASPGEASAALVTEAARWFQSAARRGSVRGMEEFARHSLYGWGVPKDPKVAYEWFRKAADLGSAAGLNGLAVLYDEGEAVKRDVAEALRLLERAAKGGSEKAMYNLGGRYATGNGVKADDAIAFQYYRDSAERGFTPAQAWLGAFYETGRGTARDPQAARRWYERAVEAGNTSAMYALANLLREGSAGKDLPRALELLTRASSAGHASSYLTLGGLYRDGEEVPRDYEKARDLLEQAADLSLPGAFRALGYLYIEGLGVEKDYRVAERYLRVAVDAGDATAMNNLGYILSRGGFGLEKDEKEALRWFLESARLGDATGRFNLANVYAGGEGVSKDFVEAYAWYSLSAAGGVKEAAAARDALEKQLTPAQVRAAQARARVFAAGTR